MKCKCKWQTRNWRESGQANLLKRWWRSTVHYQVFLCKQHWELSHHAQILCFLRRTHLWQPSVAPNWTHQNLATIFSHPSHHFLQQRQHFLSETRVSRQRVCALKTQKQRTTQTLVRGFKDRRFEVGVEPAEREFRATSPHVSAREEEERTKRCSWGLNANEEWSHSGHCCEPFVFVLLCLNINGKEYTIQKVPTNST